MSSSGCCRGPGRPSGSQLRSTPERRHGRTTLAVIQRIAGLYAVEKEGRGRPPDERVRLRQARAKPIVDDLESWLQAQLPKISGKSELAKAIRYALARMRKLRPYLERRSGIGGIATIRRAWPACATGLAPGASRASRPSRR